MGPLYAWAVDNIPLLWIVRSPWFKFTLLTVIGYAVLLGLAAPIVVRLAQFSLRRVVGVWSEPVVRRGALACTFVLFFAIGPVYAYPFTLGLAFATPAERSFLNPNHVDPPAYVYEAADWLNRQPGDFRIMTIPGDTPWFSEWGYAGVRLIPPDIDDALSLVQAKAPEPQDFSGRRRSQQRSGRSD